MVNVKMTNLVNLQDKVTELINGFLANPKNKTILDRNPKLVEFLNQLPDYFDHVMTREDLLQVAYILELIPIKKTFSFFNKITEITPSLRKEFASNVKSSEAKNVIDNFKITSLDSDKDDKAINLLNEIHSLLVTHITNTRIIDVDNDVNKELETKLAPNRYDLSLVDSQNLSVLPLIVDMDRGFSLQGVNASGLSKDEKASKLLKFCDDNKEIACLIGSLGQSLAAEEIKLIANTILDNSTVYYHEDLKEFQMKFQVLFTDKNCLIYKKNEEYFCQISLQIVALMDSTTTEVYFLNTENGKSVSVEASMLPDIQKNSKASKRFIPLLESNLLLKLDDASKKFVIIENKVFYNAEDSSNLKVNQNLEFKDFHALKNQPYVVVGENNAPPATYTFLNRFSLQKQPKLNDLGYEETIDQLSNKVRLDGKLVSEPDSIDRLLLVQEFTQSKLTDNESSNEYSTADLVFLCAHGKFDVLLATEFANLVSGENAEKLNPVNVKDAQYDFYRKEGQLYLKMSLDVRELTDNKGLFYILNPQTQQLQTLSHDSGVQNQAKGTMGNINMTFKIEDVPNGKVKLHFQEMKADLNVPRLTFESNKPDLNISQSISSNENSPRPVV